MYILKCERNKQGYLLVLDNYLEYVVDEDAYYQYGIYDFVEKNLTDDDIYILQQASEQSMFRIVKKSAYYIISKSICTAKELNNKLLKKGYEQNIVNNVIDILIKEKYIDDSQYSRNFINYRKNHKPESKRMIQFKLQNKGIDKETIDKIICETGFDEVTCAKKIFEKKYLKYMNKENKLDVKKKAYNYLSSKGFTSDVIRKVLEISLDNFE